MRFASVRYYPRCVFARASALSSLHYRDTRAPDSHICASPRSLTRIAPPFLTTPSLLAMAPPNILAAALLSAAAVAVRAAPTWCDGHATWLVCNTTASHDARAADIVARLSLADKIQSMNSGTPALPSVGLPAYNWWSEVRKEEKRVARTLPHTCSSLQNRPAFCTGERRPGGLNCPHSPACD